MIRAASQPNLLEDAKLLDPLIATEGWQTLMTFTRESARKYFPSLTSQEPRLKCNQLHRLRRQDRHQARQTMVSILISWSRYAHKKRPLVDLRGDPALLLAPGSVLIAHLKMTMGAVTATYAGFP